LFRRNRVTVRRKEGENQDGIQHYRLILSPRDIPRLLKAIDDLHAVSARFLFSGWRAEWVSPTDRDHRAILNALRAGTMNVATEVLSRHVQWMGQKPGSRS
jgi:DNA-binding GntR family transcriptional regulator